MGLRVHPHSRGQGVGTSSTFAILYEIQLKYKVGFFLFIQFYLSYEIEHYSFRIGIYTLFFKIFVH